MSSVCVLALLPPNPPTSAEPRVARLGEVGQALEALADAVSPAVAEIQVSGVGPPSEVDGAGLLAPRRHGSTRCSRPRA